MDWNIQLAEQLDWHWREQLRPRLAGLTDAEYRWEPVRGAWNVRPRGTGTAPIGVGAGEFTLDFALPHGLARPCGPAEGPYAESSMAELVLHINREMLHHGAEIALLRDLYLWHFDASGA